MPNYESADRLSWGDSVFLNLERAGMPLNVAGISILEGKIPFQEFLDFVESKLPLIPRYLKRVVVPPLNAALPAWDFDPNFDIRNHVREVTLKHGTNTELKALAGKILGTVYGSTTSALGYDIGPRTKRRSHGTHRAHASLSCGRNCGRRDYECLYGFEPNASYAFEAETSFPCSTSARHHEFSGGWARKFLFQFRGSRSVQLGRCAQCYREDARRRRKR